MITFPTLERSPRLAELKVSYKRQSRTGSLISNHWDAGRYARSIWNKDTIELYEEAVVILLNNAHCPIGWLKVSHGGMDAAIMDARVIYATALQAAATA